MNVRKLIVVMILTFVFALTLSVTKSEGDTALWKIQRTLASKKYVDLTHEFEPGIPRWSGFPDETRKTIYWYDKRPDTMGAGFFSELFTHVGQWGTHVDPPAHFVKGLRTLDQIEPKEMILPLVVIDGSPGGREKFVCGDGGIETLLLG
jgi:kynurenine formamidase